MKSGATSQIAIWFLPAFPGVARGKFRAGAGAGTRFSLFIRASLLLTLLFTSTGYPLPINILDSQYITSVNMTSLADGTSSPRTQVSPAPISDSLYSFYGSTLARADAGLWGVSAHTAAFPAAPDFIGSSSAFAESDLWFSPLTSQTTTLNVQFSAGPHFAFTYGNVSLFDVTLNHDVWNYGWGSGATYVTSVPWVITFDSGTAALALDTTLNASDTYELIMSTGSNAASDSENESFQLSGLEPAPEPSTLALAGLGLLALALMRRRGQRTPA